MKRVTAFFRRHQGTLAWLFLAAVVAFTLAQNNLDQDHSRKALIRSGTVVAVDGCNRDFLNQLKFRGLLNRLADSSKLAYKAGRTDKKSYEAAKAFYDAQLRAFSLPDCRKALHVITDETGQVRSIPTPLHPMDPHQ